MLPLIRDATFEKFALLMVAVVVVVVVTEDIMVVVIMEVVVVLVEVVITVEGDVAVDIHAKRSVRSIIRRTMSLQLAMEAHVRNCGMVNGLNTIRVSDTPSRFMDYLPMHSYNAFNNNDLHIGIETAEEVEIKYVTSNNCSHKSMKCELPFPIILMKEIWKVIMVHQ